MLARFILYSRWSLILCDILCAINKPISFLIKLPQEYFYNYNIIIIQKDYESFAIA